MEIERKIMIGRNKNMANGVQPEKRSVLKELTELGKSKGHLSNKEILDAIGEMDIDAEAMERFYDSLETNGIEIVETPLGVRLTFIDDGDAYDPLAHADPDTTLPAAERPIGGLGIFMVKRMASSIAYRRSHGRNILSVVLSA